MSAFIQKIKRYEEDIFDFDVSPFETVATLHLRSELEKNLKEMNSEEQLELLSIDVKVIKNARKVANHIKEVYDFSKSNKPDSEWWWHLDKVSSDEIKVKSHPLYTKKDVAL